MENQFLQNIRQNYLQQESIAIRHIVAQVALTTEDRIQIRDHACGLIRAVRQRSDPGVMQAFLAEYGLSTEEGVALMCLAEALLRVPDAETIDQLIEDKIVPHDWASHVGDSGSILVNASTWALMLTGRMLEKETDGVVGALQGMLRSMGEPVIRLAVERAMREMGEQFVLGQDINEATSNGDPLVQRGYTYSYDMLGEAARTDSDARHYHDAYRTAIESISNRAHSADLRNNPGISVKLSALHPRYVYTQKQTMLPVMCKRLLQLCQSAKAARVGLNIDAEEADRLDLSLQIIESVLADPSLQGWHGFGVVVQAYGQRASHVIDWLNDLASRLNRKIMVRLVKGAYWDTEIKRAQELGLAGYPVFTRKSSTDVSYIACASKLMSMRERIYPQFATHNAHTIAAVLKLAGEDKDDFEFQRLHGMGDALHDIVKLEQGTRCRIYAPVGTHEDLLAYLVRRLLENGANSSFVNQIVDQSIAPEEIAEDPFIHTSALDQISNPRIESPRHIFGRSRVNSQGWDINDRTTSDALITARQQWVDSFLWQIDGPAVLQTEQEQSVQTLFNPAVPGDTVGTIINIAPSQVDKLVKASAQAHLKWAAQDVTFRSQCLLDAAELFEQNAAEFFALLGREAGKTLEDAIAELREAVDFLRYYAVNAAKVEPGTRSRGVIVCISPWNFPLAIFSGQIAAALVTGNTVLAKPAEQTPLVAARAVALLHQAGIPESVLILVPGSGETVGAELTANSDIAGVCFTGSTDVAQLINRQIAQSGPEDAMLVAETGGINAMVIDSTALMEQAVEDIVVSAFRSAGQRCSALRIVYVQEDIYDRLMNMLKGAMDALVVGDPLDIQTDVGPIIDAEAQQSILDYLDGQKQRGKLLHQVEVPPTGYFVGPCIIEVNGIEEIEREVFGPVLHLAQFESDQLGQVVQRINAKGYGLTFGLHTRIDKRVQELVNLVDVGNFYVNRNQIGAIVGSQPFGGEGLSGTGPKAGGPHYLRRFRRYINVSTAEKPSAKLTPDFKKFRALCGSLVNMPLIPRTERVDQLRQLLRGRADLAMAAAAALDVGPVDLPGPTGEANQLSLHPIGTVLCLSENPESLLDMVVQGLRAGNRVVACGNNARRHLLGALSGGGFPLVAIDGIPKPNQLGELDINAVAMDDTINTQEVKKFLAEETGPIVRVITERIYPAAYTVERSLCIDTTAAGGNAALLADSA